MFAFVPRKVAQRNRGPSTAGAPASTSTPPAIPLPTVRKGKGKAIENIVKDDGISSEDLSVLLSLSLSIHALWADPDLRRNIELNKEGYIPLTYLIRNSVYLASLNPAPSEADLVKAIRSHLNDVFEVRMLVTSPSRSVWYGKQHASAKDSMGGYELRWKDWEDVLKKTRSGSRNDWEERILYVECIPPKHRTVAAINRFINALLDLPNAVQSITLPRHHQDKPSDIPKCKGFSLVVLSSVSEVEQLLQSWPWDRQLSSQHEDKSSTDVVMSPEASEARKFGFRVLTKSKWEKLNVEYRTYQQRLLHEMAEATEITNNEHITQAETEEVDSEREVEPPQNLVDDNSMPQTTTHSQQTQQTMPYSPYPYNCLVFVRNIHPETNKTTLRTLLSRGFAENAHGIDYVDFNKGMDTCYLRLSTPSHTNLLETYFTQTPFFQSSGLDNVGSSDDSSGKKPIVVERVDDKREELYWEKVPEKVRKAAVDKAVASQVVRADVGDGVDNPERKKKKRRVR
ncbi:hypothetical protein C8Q75DRAFT_775798 [Abortiporus biennis]|nr:hypothetical protein C8Q75DRAFT_775798 [Abortiporus biennis]